MREDKVKIKESSGLAILSSFFLGYHLRNNDDIFIVGFILPSVYSTAMYRKVSIASQHRE